MGKCLLLAQSQQPAVSFDLGRHCASSGGVGGRGAGHIYAYTLTFKAVASVEMAVPPAMVAGE